MDQQLAESLSRQLKISLEHIVREEYEWLILQKLMESPLGDAMVFRGFDQRALRRELRKYLPTNHWQVIEQWGESNQKT